MPSGQTKTKKRAQHDVGTARRVKHRAPWNVFDLMAPDYRWWRRMAESLKSAATTVADDWGRRLDEKFRTGTLGLGDLGDEPHVAMLLAGLAIENLAKGLVIRREGRLVKGQLPKGFTTHGAVSHLERAMFKLSREDRRFLKHLEEYVVWAGRYPVPKHRRVDLRRGTGMSLPEIGQFLKLYERIDQALIEPTSMED